MIVHQKVTGRATSIPVGLAAGLGMAVGFSTLAIALAAYLISEAYLPMDAIGYCAIITLLGSSYFGAKVATGKIKRLRIQMSLISGGIYFLLLLAITAIFLKGEYEGVGVTLFVVASGAILSAITGNSDKNRTGKRIRKKRTW